MSRKISFTAAFLAVVSPLVLSSHALGQDVTRFQSSSFQACLSFSDAMSLSAARDPEVLIAKANEREAGAAVADARSLYRPQISAFGRTGLGETGAVDNSVSNQVGIRASQRVIDFGDAKYARRAATANLAASAQDTRQASATAALETGLSWLEIREAREQIDLTQARREYFLQQVTAVDRALEQGGATRTERASVASQLADAEGFVLELEFREDRAKTQLKIDTGKTSRPCSGDGQLESKTLQLESVAFAKDLALSQNPQITALRKRADALEAQRKRQSRFRLPIIDLVATGSYASLNRFENFEFRDRIGVDVSVPLYSGNSLKAGNQRARARLSIAQNQTLNSERQLTEDVEISVRRIKSLTNQLNAREEVEKQTRLQFEAAEIEQGVGVRTLRDLIDIRLEYEQAGLQTIRTRYDLLRERLRLMSLTSQFSFNETL